MHFFTSKGFIERRWRSISEENLGCWWSVMQGSRFAGKFIYSFPFFFYGFFVGKNLVDRWLKKKFFFTSFKKNIEIEVVIKFISCL